MKLINNILYIEMPDFEKAGYTATNMYSYVSKCYSTLPFIKENGNLLFPYNDKLGKTYKELPILVSQFEKMYNSVAAKF